MKSGTVLIVGCGDIGTRVGETLVGQGCRVVAVRRATDLLPAAFEAVAADYTEPGSLDFAADLQPDYVLAIFNPAGRSEAGYRRGFSGAMDNLLRGLDGHRPRHVLMSSSTRVFAERGGGWVDENSALTTDDAPALAIIDAEQALLRSGLPASVVRFAGIYGATGGRLLARIRRGELYPPEPLRYTNRIHRQDCSGFLLHLLGLARRGDTPAPVYIGVDNLPAPRHEVDAWLAAQLGVEPATAPAAGDAVEGARGPAGHRRCRNNALRESGYALRYPDYRAGYAALLESEEAGSTGC
ncbi:MAG: hypothetical protein R3228_13875 [Halioglobus sp.]|nr:hypothetical protein [Halioglobus sp.]